MSEVRLAAVDAIELFELLQLVNDWISVDPIARRRLSRFIDNPAWTPDDFCIDLDRFVFLVGGSDGEHFLHNNGFR